MHKNHTVDTHKHGLPYKEELCYNKTDVKDWIVV